MNMGGKTKKVKTTGRFGARYGVGIRKRVLKVEMKQKAKHSCPYCGFAAVKRQAPGIFVCRKCNSKFAGGAYIPSTMTGNIVKKIVSQKTFGVSAEKMLEEAEKKPEFKEQEDEKGAEERKEHGKKHEQKEDSAVEAEDKE